MSIHKTRLAAVRAELARRRLDGFILPLADEHLSEYIGAYAKRLEWLSGFEGSAGSAVVLSTSAAIFVDGRYTLQLREQVPAEYWSYQTLPRTSVAEWLAEHAVSGSRIGYDPWLHSQRWVISARAILAQFGVELVAVDQNPIDAAWVDRPLHSEAKLVVHPDDVAGRSSIEKRLEIAGWLTAMKADVLVLSALDSVAWTFNVRGGDVDHTPVALAFAIINADGTGDLFIAPEKLTTEVVAHLGCSVRLHSYDSFSEHLGAFANRKVAVDPDRSVAAIVSLLGFGGALVVEIRDPTVLAKAIKNSAEIAGHKMAQERDGVALTRFLHWLSVAAPKGGLDEIGAAIQLQKFREDTGCLRGLSFYTISAAGPNAASPHYKVTSRSCREIKSDQIYLVDSGGQYADGTTDVTRTVIVGRPTVEIKDRFTRVLKGHIAIARAVFPVGTRGIQLDILARQYLWAAGLDYAHGTGHGVGAYLGVHEGPQRIGRNDNCNEPLQPGMILSNEPGYYKDHKYGIRIENLVLTVRHDIVGAENQMMSFETLTLAPIDHHLIDGSMLSPEERTWINCYHAQVAKIIGRHLEGASKAWLLDATQPLI